LGQLTRQSVSASYSHRWQAQTHASYNACWPPDHTLTDDILFLPGEGDEITLYGGGLTHARVVIGRDRDELLRRAAAVIKRSNEKGEPAGWLAGNSEWVAGTVDQVVARLRELQDAGVERVMLQHLVQEDLETVELLGREVVPAVA
jgi:hypothetical protein